MLLAPGTLSVLYGTETGNAACLAERALVASTRVGLTARLSDMATYNTYRLSAERCMLIIVSTHGDGEPPQSTSDFFDFLDERQDRLEGLRFGLLALGDSGYPEFCGAGKHLDERLRALGAVPLLARREIDCGELKQAGQWIDEFVQMVAALSEVAS